MKTIENPFKNIGNLLKTIEHGLGIEPDGVTFPPVDHVLLPCLRVWPRAHLQVAAAEVALAHLAANRCKIIQNPSQSAPKSRETPSNVDHNRYDMICHDLILSYTI